MTKILRLCYMGVLVVSAFSSRAQSTKIQQIEYYFDNDPGFGNASTVSIMPAQSDLSNFPVTPSIAALPRGLHVLYVRALDEANRWSTTAPQAFFKESFANLSIPSAVAAEYFFDVDPGVGLGKQLAVTAGETVTIPFNGDVSSLSKGLHNLFVRVKDANGNWSLATSELFYKEATPNNTVPNLVAAEYFFDTDPGFGNGTAITFTAGPMISVPVSTAITALSNGLHQLYVRVKDASGKWSVTTSEIFYKEASVNTAIPNVVAAEYFFDTDPGFGKGNGIAVAAGSPVSINISAGVGALNAGLHNLYVRTKDASGKWSMTTCQRFFKEAPINTVIPDAVAAEYFFDTDPGFGKANAISITAGPVITQAFNAGINALTAGLHILYVRVKDANGKWSVTTNEVFFKEPSLNNVIPNIVTAEYFFDSDPGFGNANAISFTASSSISEVFNAGITSLTNGLHVLYVRAKDANGKWSMTTRELFFKEPVLDNSIPNIVAAEYFVDSDPGFGNGVAINVSPQSQTVSQPFTIPSGGFTKGLHQFYLRVKDANGKWSLTRSQLFYYETIVAEQPIGDLVKFEWFWNTDPGFGNATPVTIPAGNNGQVTLAFNVSVHESFSGTKQNLYLRVLDDWSLTTVKLVDFTSLVVPVTLLDFSVQTKGNIVNTHWSTTQEINSEYFEIERSDDAAHFTKIGRVAAAGSASHRYSFDDEHPASGFNYYRLKMVDKEGSFTYSGVAKVFFAGGRDGIYSYPNPVKDQVIVLLPATANASGMTIQLFDNNGALMVQKTATGKITPVMMSNLPAAQYIIIVRDKSGKMVYRQSVVKD